jgi:DNA processing protein
MTPGLGPRGMAELKDFFGGIDNFLDRVPEISRGEKNGLRPKWFGEYRKVLASDGLKREIEFIEKEDIGISHVYSEGYPEQLLNIYDPPAVLFKKGKLELAGSKVVAIVGARRCSDYGLRMAEDLSFALASAGVVVSSGLAAGIDAAAHKGALKAGGKTVAVVGSGFKYIYPSAHKALFGEICEKGAVLTEFTSGIEPSQFTFPRRNRIISGISHGVVVVEAASRSGSLITASYALEQGREVMAVPGKIDSLLSAGANRLIKDGATLVTSAEDVLEAIGHEGERGGRGAELFAELYGGLSAEERKVLSALSGKGPVHIDDISESAGLEMGKLNGVLMGLELKKVIRNVPGRNFVIEHDKIEFVAEVKA